MTTTKDLDAIFTTAADHMNDLALDGDETWADVAHVLDGYLDAHDATLTPHEYAAVLGRLEHVALAIAAYGPADDAHGHAPEHDKAPAALARDEGNGTDHQKDTPMIKNHTQTTPTPCPKWCMRRRCHEWDSIDADGQPCRLHTRELRRYDDVIIDMDGLEHADGTREPARLRITGAEDATFDGDDLRGLAHQLTKAAVEFEVWNEYDEFTGA